jgi:hypothetical protein
VLQQAAAAVDGEAPAPEALVESFGESSVDFAIRYRHAPETLALWQVRSRVAMAAKSALETAGSPSPSRTGWSICTVPSRLAMSATPKSPGPPRSRSDEVTDPRIECWPHMRVRSPDGVGTREMTA